jgi:hypothetical protein
MNPPPQIIEDLNTHFTLTDELLHLAERECQALRRADGASLFEFYQTRKALLPRFSQSVETLRQHRIKWQKLSPDERSQFPQVPVLLRRSQDLTMKVIVLDRENEQLLLRRGLVPPRELPSVNRQRPHFVANLYKQQS